jgi:hypothetical protein
MPYFFSARRLLVHFKSGGVAILGNIDNAL